MQCAFRKRRAAEARPGDEGRQVVEIEQGIAVAQHQFGLNRVDGRSFLCQQARIHAPGADQHIDYQAKPFEEVSPQVDVIIDAIGGDHIDRSLKVLKEGGTIISLPSGVSESVGGKAAAQNKKGIFFLVNSNEADIISLSDLFAAGKLHSRIAKVFSFEEVKQAHKMIETGKTAGKVVMKGPA